MNEQPEAMKLAAVIEQFGGASAYLCAAMLRRQHAEIERLREVLRPFAAGSWTQEYASNAREELERKP